MNHWCSTYALVKYLDEVEKTSLSQIIVFYPDTPEGKQTFNGWSIPDPPPERFKQREPVKQILEEASSSSCKIVPYEISEIKEEKDIWLFLNKLTTVLGNINHSSVIIDITLGFRLFQSLLFSFVYYFENVSSNILEKIYYAISRGPNTTSKFVQLDQLVMLQHEISHIKLLIENLDISAFEWAKSKVKALRNVVLELQKIMLFLNSGVASDELLGKLNRFLSSDHFTRKPQNIFKEYDDFYRNSFYQGIIPELETIKKEIFGENDEIKKLWKRQLNLARLLLTRKMDFSTSLGLVRESFISWLCEDILDLDPLDTAQRERSDELFRRFRFATSTNEHGINESSLFGEVNSLSVERNDYAHVFTTSEKINRLGNKSQNLNNHLKVILDKIDSISMSCSFSDSIAFFTNLVAVFNQ